MQKHEKDKATPIQNPHVPHGLKIFLWLLPRPQVCQC